MALTVAFNPNQVSFDFDSIRALDFKTSFGLFAAHMRRLESAEEAFSDALDTL